MSCNFHLHQILHVPDRSWRNSRFAAAAVKKYRFIHGHLHFEFLKNQLDSARTVTFLRDPVQRVLSLYFFLRAQDPEKQNDAAGRFLVEQARGLSASTFAEHTHPIIAAMVSNYQLCVLLSSAQAERANQRWVASALENLEKYQFVGIADPDLIADSTQAMNRIFGWTATKDVPRVNQTTRTVDSVELTRARDVIVARNELEIALYGEIRQRLQVSLKSSGKRTNRERIALRRERRKYRTGLVSPITMDQPLRCWGWHDRETNPRRKDQYWRCGSQLRSGLELRVPTGSDIILLFEISSAHPRISLEQTLIETRGCALRSNLLLANKQWVIGTVIQRQHVAADGFLSLEVVCKERENCKPLASEPDSRFVTFALQRISVFSEDTVGSMNFEILWRSICELGKAREHATALLERAERSEAYCAGLKAELEKAKDVALALSNAREREHVEAQNYGAALTDRAMRAEAYCASLESELKKRDGERGEAEKHQSALTDRAARAETYCAALKAELNKQQEHYRALASVREREQADAVANCTALNDRAVRAEQYCAALKKELEKQNSALAGSRQESKPE